MECSECKEIKTATKEVKYPCFPCDLCRNLYCIDCSELTSSEIKCIPLQKRLLKYHCKKCRNYELLDLLRNTIDDKNTIIKAKDEFIKLLQEKLTGYEEKEAKEIPSYAYILNKKADNKQNFASIVIKPKVAQNVAQTKKDIIEKVNPAELKIGIKNLRTRNDTVIINCSTKIENEILETTIKNKLNEDYSVETNKMKKPKIKITNFKEEMTAETIEKSIIEQNQLTEGVKVTYLKKQKSGAQTIYCECSPKAFMKLMSMRKIYIGWQRYAVYENLDIPRCFKCQGFYHKKTNCKNKMACATCGEEHNVNECPKQTKYCINCENSNKKYKTKHNTSHESTDIECPTLKFHKEILKQKTDYNT